MDKEEALRLLKGGEEGIREWNLRRRKGEKIPSLEKIDLHDMNLEGVNLFGANLERGDFNNANLSGADLQRAILSHASFRCTNLSNANLSEAKINGANLIRANLKSARLCGADLGNASLSRADLHVANLSRSSLSHVNLSSAYLAGAKLNVANLEHADLQHAKFNGAELVRASLDNSDVRHADLSKANLEEATLGQADLRHTNFTAANLSRASLRGANLVQAVITGANLAYADLREANVSSVIYDKNLLLSRCRGVRVDMCFGDVNFKLDLKDQDYIDSVGAQWCCTRLGRLFFKQWRFLRFGKSVTRIAIVATVASFLFGTIFFIDWILGPILLDYSVSANSPLSPYYYSVVTYTTLGFGDITPKHWIGELVVMAEVIMGYVTLGLLVVVFANKIVGRT